jgi:hypothetical protein
MIGLADIPVACDSALTRILNYGYSDPSSRIREGGVQCKSEPEQVFSLFAPERDRHAT